MFLRVSLVARWITKQVEPALFLANQRDGTVPGTSGDGADEFMVYAYCNWTMSGGQYARDANDMAVNML